MILTDIKRKARIIVDEGATLFGQAVTSSTTIVGLIEKADKNPSVIAILFDINIAYKDTAKPFIKDLSKI